MDMMPSSRETYLLDELQLYTTRGLPPQVRSRLLVQASRRQFRAKHEKLAKLVLARIQRDLVSAAGSEVIRQLTGQAAVEVKAALCIIPVGELSLSNQGRIIGSAFLTKNTRMNQDDRSELVNLWPATALELKSAATVIYSDAPASDEDAYIVKLVRFCDCYDRQHRLEAWVDKADRAGDPQDRDGRKWMLRDRNGRIHLLLDNHYSGLRLQPPAELKIVNLLTRAVE